MSYAAAAKGSIVKTPEKKKEQVLGDISRLSEHIHRINNLVQKGFQNINEIENWRQQLDGGSYKPIAPWPASVIAAYQKYKKIQEGIPQMKTDYNLAYDDLRHNSPVEQMIKTVELAVKLSSSIQREATGRIEFLTTFRNAYRTFEQIGTHINWANELLRRARDTYQGAASLLEDIHEAWRDNNTR